MTVENVDVLVSGGGIAGLTAAAAFGSAGFSVVCVDPAAPVTDGDADGADLRTTALLQPARAIFEKSGLWSRVARDAAPLQVMRIADAGGVTGGLRKAYDFDAADISDQPFGWNLPNWLLRRETVARLGELQAVSFRPGTGTARVTAREREARVTLTDGAQVSARLLVAADGRNSMIREAFDIPVRTRRYGQKALAFAVTHAIPHNNISTEVHRFGGPFTLVPLPDRNGKPCSAVVWMERGPEALRLSRLPVDAFEAAMTERSCEVLGPLTLASQITVWPIISQIAARFHAQRTALIAEAAHVVPPIGAQGLNMSLGDIATLLNLAEADPGALGSAKMLDTYTRRRWPDVQVRVAGIDTLNRAAMLEPRPLRDLRAAALGLLHGARPVRRTLMRAGLGVR